MEFDLKSKVGEILKDGRAVEILEKYAPGLATHPLVGLFKGKTLESLVSLPQAKQYGLTTEMITNFLSEVNKKK